MNYYGNPYYQPNIIDYGSRNTQFQPINQPTSTDERIWVQSEQAAEAYLVAPSSFVRLWDSNRPVFYEKRADATGKPFPMEVYEYSRKAVESSNSASLTSSNAIDYQSEISALNERIEALENIMKKGVKNNAKQSNENATDVQTIPETVRSATVDAGATVSISTETVRYFETCCSIKHEMDLILYTDGTAVATATMMAGNIIKLA